MPPPQKFLSCHEEAKTPLFIRLFKPNGTLRIITDKLKDVNLNIIVQRVLDNFDYLSKVLSDPMNNEY